MAPTFGHIGTARPGDLFASRGELALLGQHRPLQAGICATQAAGAESIVLSDKYEDDEIHADYLLYTGHGGRDQETGKQVADQTLTKSNLGLVRSQVTGLPVRVFRRIAASGSEQFRYEGLFRVVNKDFRLGKSGFMVYLFRLEPIVESGGTSLISSYSAFDDALPSANEPAARYEATTSRIIRDTSITRDVKQLYAYYCQVCDYRLETPAGYYAEAAHIRPLGAPHNGPDDLGNVLCLCPNHHILFDFGSFSVAEDYSLIGLPGYLTVKPAHRINAAFLAYHRAHIYVMAKPIFSE